MIDIQAFVKSMKLTWLKRLITSTAESTYVAANELPKIENILSFGSKKLKNVIQSIQNPFWKM